MREAAAFVRRFRLSGARSIEGGAFWCGERWHRQGGRVCTNNNRHIRHGHGVGVVDNSASVVVPTLFVLASKLAGAYLVKFNFSNAGTMGVSLFLIIALLLLTISP